MAISSLLGESAHGEIPLSKHLPSSKGQGNGAYEWVMWGDRGRLMMGDGFAEW